jgi:potassium-transporting ATPase KdpC subunit
MKFGEHLRVAFLMTVVTTVLLGLAYPLAITGLAQALFPDKANGQLIRRDGRVVGSRIIGQPFSGPGYFHSRPSAAGTGYDATASGGSNLGPTNRALINRVTTDVASLSVENAAAPVPIDLVTTSASGLDPDMSPAAAEFQVGRVARARGVDEEKVLILVRQHSRGRQFAVLGEPRVNVLELNLALDGMSARPVTH